MNDDEMYVGKVGTTVASTHWRAIYEVSGSLVVGPAIAFWGFIDKVPYGWIFVRGEGFIRAIDWCGPQGTMSHVEYKFLPGAKEGQPVEDEVSN